MTVQELRDILDGMDGSMEVCIAHYQRCGSDLGNSIRRVENGYMRGYWVGEFTKTINIVMGEQIGTPYTERQYREEMAEEEEE